MISSIVLFVLLLLAAWLIWKFVPKMEFPHAKDVAYVGAIICVVGALLILAFGVIGGALEEVDSGAPAGELDD